MPSKPNSQCVPTEHTHLIPTYGQAACNKDSTIINIQIQYNPNAPMEPELWDGSFYPFLSMDLLNIKHQILKILRIH